MQPKTTALLLLAPWIGSCSFDLGDARGAEIGVELVRVSSERLERPTWFGPIPSGDAPAGLSHAWHALALQEGQVLRVRVAATGAVDAPQVWFDLQDEISRIGNEEGLLGLAFHPDYPADPRLYVHFSARGEARGQIWEMTVGADGAPDPARRRLVLEVAQPWRNHNGGEIRFGKDRMLYVGLGDGGAGGDPRRAGQDLGNLLGKILRIDVDAPEAERVAGAGYGIPKDNPFVGIAGAREEIWALGLRNPWRFNFDPTRDGIWVGDVGQNRFEEIDFVRRGGNYGWSSREAFEQFDPKTLTATDSVTDPVVAYPRKLGASVTGGAVYVGRAVLGLSNRYVYADYVSGAVWAIDADPEDPGEPQLIATVPSPASFGVDAWGELYVLSFANGLYRLEPLKVGP